MPTVTPLRRAAHEMAAQAGYPFHEVKVAESKKAHVHKLSGYDVFVREPGTQRGKCIGSIPWCLVAKEYQQ